MRITVKYFASIREAIGQASELRDTAAATLAELRDELLAASPVHAATLARGRSVRMALNHVMSDERAQRGLRSGIFPARDRGLTKSRHVLTTRSHHPRRFQSHRRN